MSHSPASHPNSTHSRSASFPEPVASASPGAADNGAGKLGQRGIADAARRARWQTHTLEGRRGWQFPIPYPGGTAYRWKAADGQKPKNKWLGGKPKACKYYTPQGASALAQAIAAAGGVVWIANGEPSLLAHISAGLLNVICWFGEGQPPHTLADDLKRWGVRTVCYPADKDAAGRAGAIRVRSRLKDSDIAFRPLLWGDEIPDGGDANDAWIAVGFDAPRFSHLLNHLSALLLPADEPPPKRIRPVTGGKTVKREDAIAAIIDQACARPGRAGHVRHNGEYVNFCCLLHDEHEPSAGINTRTGTYTCFVCGTLKLAEICERVGIDYPPRLPIRQPGTTLVAEQHTSEPALRAPSRPLRLREVGLFMLCCPTYPLLERHVLPAGIADDFTAAEVAGLVGVSLDTAQDWIDKALEWSAVSERSAFLQGIGNSDNSIVRKKAERQSLRGAAVARRYCLTPDLARPLITRALPDRVQELMEKGDPAPIRKAEAAAAGLNDADSARLELVTSETAETLDAWEVSAQDEREAARKARELIRRAEVDETPFTSEEQPRSVRELRTLLIEALWATNPNAVWKHRDYMWIAGVKRGSVGALIRKSSRIAPSATPTFIDVEIKGQDLHRAARAECRKHQGSPVAWLGKDGKVIESFSRVVPKGAAGVKLNVGKTYVRREQAEPQRAAPAPSISQSKAERPRSTPTSSRKRAQRATLPRLRGCLRARGWRLVPGAFGYWERADQEQPNTWEGMAAALLLDYEWAHERQETRMSTEHLVIFAEAELGAVVTRLAA